MTLCPPGGRAQAALLWGAVPEEAQHPTCGPIPWASHLTRRTTFLGYLLTIRHSVTREHLPRPKSRMSSPPLFYALLGTFPFLFSGTYHCGLILCRAGVGCTESEALRENGLGLFISGPKTCLLFSYNQKEHSKEMWQLFPGSSMPMWEKKKS